MELIDQVSKHLQQHYPEAKFEIIDERGDLKHLKLNFNVINTNLHRLSRLDQHKQIYKVLHEFFQTNQIHALKINIIS